MIVHDGSLLPARQTLHHRRRIGTASTATFTTATATATTADTVLIAERVDTSGGIRREAETGRSSDTILGDVAKRVGLGNSPVHRHA